jgi:uncharacterized damage-inducible protein DinB
VNSIPDDQWKVGEIAQLVPARLLYHILSGTEVYARSCSYEEYKSRCMFKLDWQDAAAAELPARHAALGYIDEMEKRVGEWLDELGDEGLLSSDEGFPWTGTRKLGRALYLMRHTQNHAGDMNSELRRRGLPRGKWR